MATVAARCRREIVQVWMADVRRGGARSSSSAARVGVAVGVGATLAPRTPLAVERRNSALVIFVFANTKHGSFCDGYAHYLMNIVNLIILGLLSCVLWMRCAESVLCSCVHSFEGGGRGSGRLGATPPPARRALYHKANYNFINKK